MPEISTLCGICGQPASFKCKLCGKMVCKEHLDAKTGICASCSGRGRTYH